MVLLCFFVFALWDNKSWVTIKFNKHHETYSCGRVAHFVKTELQVWPRWCLISPICKAGVYSLRDKSLTLHSSRITGISTLKSSSVFTTSNKKKLLQVVSRDAAIEISLDFDVAAVLSELQVKYGPEGFFFVEKGLSIWCSKLIKSCHLLLKDSSYDYILINLVYLLDFGRRWEGYLILDCQCWWQDWKQRRMMLMDDWPEGGREQKYI